MNQIQFVGKAYNLLGPVYVHMLVEQILKGLFNEGIKEKGTVMKKNYAFALLLSIVLSLFNKVQAQVSISQAVTHVTCPGGSNGSINITASGGTAPYTFLWNGGTNTEDRVGLAAGVYTLTVTDAASATASLSISVNQPSPIFVNKSITNVACGGANTGAINITVSGGTGGYTYQWSNSATTEDVSNLTAALYYLTITDVNGCIKVDSANVTQPPGMVLSRTVTNVTCASGANGGVNLTVQFGSSPYSFAWSNGVAVEDLVGVAAGNYTVTVTDAGGCTASISATVGQSGSGMSINHTATNPTCFGGTNGVITVTSVIGSVAPYSYAWSNGVTTQSNTGIPAGTYNVTVTSTTGCTASKTISIAQPTALNTVLNVVPVSCFNGNNGAINSSTAGGSSPFTYAWSHGAFTQNATSLPTGNYSLTVTDSKGCTATATAFVPQPLELTLTAVPSPLACTGGPTGSVMTTVNGGTGPYTYWWGGGVTTPNRVNVGAGTYTVTVTDGNGCTTTASTTIPSYTPMSTSSTQVNNVCFGGNTGSVNLTVTMGLSPFTFNWSNGATTEDISNLTAGSYTVTVTDSRSCTVTRNVTITQPPFGMTINSTLSNVTCNGYTNGSITLNVVGGTSPYTYNWGGGITTQNRTNIPAGNYSVTVTDNAGCTASASFVITQPAGMSVSLTPNSLICNGAATGSITSVVTGGTAPYTYNWSNGATSQNLTSVVAGAYTVSVGDQSSCIATATATINQPAAISITPSATNATCNGGSNGAITLSVTGGTSPYTFNWGGGVTTQNRTALTAGSYTVTITDNNSCTATSTTNITEPSAIGITSTVTNVACNGGNNGAINLTVSGGNAPYSFSWNGGFTSQNRTNLIAGTYNVTVTDNTGCTAAHAATVSQTTTLSVSSIVTNVTCNGGNNGAVTLNVSGGSSPYSFNWGGGITTQNRTALAAGSYTVTVTDNAGCTMSNTAVVSQSPSITIAPTVTNVACAGGNTGAITLAVSGGNSPYAFNWGGGITTQNRTSLSSGTYTVTVTDNTGCTATSSSVVNQNASLTLSTTVTDVNCNGGNNGAITLTVNGGTTPYGFSWNGGVTTQNRSALTAGNYNVTVTDNFGCSGSASATVTQPAALTVSAINVNVTCNGGNNGAVNLNVSGGNSPYNFAWNGGVTTQNRTNLTAGTYNVTVTDANTCTVSASSVITQPAAINIAINKTDVLCNGQNTGSIIANVNGGNGGFTYNWSNGQATPSLVALVANTYQLTVTDANTCTASAVTILTQPAALVTTVTTTNVNCFGATTGVVDLGVSGGAGSYNYNWSNSATTQDLSNVGAGNYQVSITDGNNCQITATATISQPAQIQLNSSVANIGCAGATSGSITLNVTGGNSPYNYNWNNGATTASVTNLNAGAYSVTVNDNTSCSTTASFNIVSAAPLSLNHTKTNVSCNGGFNGSIQLTPNGGTGPYTYYWHDGITTQNRNVLTAATYSVTVTDANNCTASAAITLTQPSAIVLTTTKTNVDCNGAATGSISLTVSGGAPGYSFLWSNNFVNQNLSGVTAGTYSVTVTDATFCTASATEIITQPSAIGLSLNTQNVTCFGGNNGSITVTVSGGNGGYVYTWSNGATTAANTNLTAGNYNLSVADALGCGTSLNLNVTQPAAITLTQTNVPVSCFGGNNGSINLSVSGGTPGYVYTWSNGAATQDISNLTAGTYSVQVKDNNNCSANLSVTVTEPAALSATTSTTNAVCSGSSTGAVALTVNGGQSPYSFNWSNSATTQNITNVLAGNYNVTVTDNSGCTASASATVSQSSAMQISVTKIDATCFGAATGSVTANVNGGNGSYTYNWTNGGNTATVNNLSAGSYSVTVTDAQNCSASGSATIGQPATISISKTVNQVSCNGLTNGAVNVTVAGGQTPYLFAWSNGASTEDVSNLSAGSFTVTVTDASSCSAQDNTTITEPAAISLSETNVPFACTTQPGSIDVTVSGGTAPYTYNWSNNATTQDIQGLNQGSYTLTLTDANSCTSSISVNIAALPALSVTTTKTDVVCNGESTGAIDVTVNGGTTPYNFVWTGGATTEDLTSIAAGNYTVTVTDNSNCASTQSVTIAQPAAININPVVTSISCNGGNDGTIQTAVSGGNSPYVYNWSNGSTTASVSGLGTGSYNLTVTDATNCSAQAANLLVNEPAVLNVSLSTIPVSCIGRTDGEVSATVTGGTTPYTFNWSNGATSQNITNLTTGTYSVSVTDNKGCTASQTADVIMTAPLAINATVNNTACAEVATGSIVLDITGGTPAYNFDWSNGNTTTVADNLAIGNYTVTVTDIRNCTATSNYSISFNYTLTVEAGPSTLINLGESVVLTATTNVNNGNTYNWSPGIGVDCNNCASTEARPTKNTIYSVIVTDANGCTAQDTAFIEVNSVTDIFIPNAFSPNNDNNNDVFKIYGDLNTITYLDFKVFNRWGETIYATNNHYFEWDGTYKGEVIDRGSYIYTMKVVFINGTSTEYKGSITTIR